MSDNKLEKRFQKNQWYLSREQLIKFGLTQYSIKNLEENKIILKITNSLYRWTKVDFEGNDDFLDISHIEPKGVFCLYTAMNFYKLTSFVSNKYFLAIPRERWIRKGLAQYPIVVKKWKDEFFDLGVDLIRMGRFTFRIYNLEKTICDCVKYRKELGLNTLKEVLTAYLHSKKRNMHKLSTYAETLGVATILKEYTGMIL